MVDDSHLVPIIGKTKKRLLNRPLLRLLQYKPKILSQDSNEFYPNAGWARSDITLNQFLQKKSEIEKQDARRRMIFKGFLVTVPLRNERYYLRFIYQPV